MNFINTTQTIPKKEESNKIIKSNNNQKPKEENPTDITNTEVGTTISHIAFLETNPKLEDIKQNPIIEPPIPKDTISTSTGTNSNNSQQDTSSSNSNSNKLEKPRMSFAGKTKQWAGNVWNSIKNMKIKNMFPKKEYQEYRNANGDIVKIPKKKLPLKKKKNLNENVNNRVSMEQDKIVNTYHGAATGLYIIS